MRHSLHNISKLILNSDQATLKFILSLSDAMRERGTELYHNGAVTYIKGNRQDILAKVQDVFGIHHIHFHLYNNQWFGFSFTANALIAGAAMYAVMLERVSFGKELPIYSKIFDATFWKLPLATILEAKLKRPLMQNETKFLSKLEERYHHYLFKNQFYDSDMLRLCPDWNAKSRNKPIFFSSTPPTNILEFWENIAHVLNRHHLSYPAFLKYVPNIRESLQASIH